MLNSAVCSFLGYSRFWMYFHKFCFLIDNSKFVFYHFITILILAFYLYNLLFVQTVSQAFSRSTAVICRCKFVFVKIDVDFNGNSVCFARTQTTVTLLWFFLYSRLCKVILCWRCCSEWYRTIAARFCWFSSLVSEQQCFFPTFFFRQRWL